jgi:copper oxidase (laccase) domain-containing protein
VIANGVAAVGGPVAAAIGPAIGPCCYDVGPDVSALFDADLSTGGRLDLWAAAERALRAAGVEEVERLDVCTSCHPELFFSHRRDDGITGRQGVIGVIA